MHNLDPNNAIKSIFGDEQWLIKTGIGGMAYAGSLLLLMINFFMLPLVIIVLACAQGYLLRVMRTEVATPGSKLPEWNDIGDLFVSGLTWMAVNTFFAVIVLLAAVYLAFIFMWTSVPQVYVHLPSLGAIIIIVGAVLYAFTSFVLTFLMVNLAVQETNAAGFQILTVLKKASANRNEFLAAWLVGDGLKLVCFVIPAATVVGAFLLPSVVFIAQIAAAKFAAQAWIEAKPGSVLAGEAG